MYHEDYRDYCYSCLNQLLKRLENQKKDFRNLKLFSERFNAFPCPSELYSKKHSSILRYCQLLANLDTSSYFRIHRIGSFTDKSFIDVIGQILFHDDFLSILYSAFERFNVSNLIAVKKEPVFDLTDPCHNYFVARTLRDCSVFIRITKNAFPGFSLVPVSGASTTYYYNIQAIDLDEKPHSKLDSYYERHRKLGSLAESLDKLECFRKCRSKGE